MATDGNVPHEVSEAASKALHAFGEAILAMRPVVELGRQSEHAHTPDGSCIHRVRFPHGLEMRYLDGVDGLSYGMEIKIPRDAMMHTRAVLERFGVDPEVFMTGEPLDPELLDALSDRVELNELPPDPFLEEDR